MSGLILLGVLMTSVGATSIICIICDRHVDPWLGAYPDLLEKSLQRSRKTWLYSHPRLVIYSGLFSLFLGVIAIIRGIPV